MKDKESHAVLSTLTLISGVASWVTCSLFSPIGFIFAILAISKIKELSESEKICSLVGSFCSITAFVVFLIMFFSAFISGFIEGISY